MSTLPSNAVLKGVTDYTTRASDREPPKDFAEAIDHSWSVFALPDFFRALSLTFKYFLDRKVPTSHVYRASGCFHGAAPCARIHCPHCE